MKLRYQSYFYDQTGGSRPELFRRSYETPKVDASNWITCDTSMAGMGGI